MSPRLRALGVLVCVCVVALPGHALELRWHLDTGVSARSLPLVADADGDGRPDVVLTTRHDGTLWLVNAGGQVLNKIPRTQWLEGSAALGRQPDGTPVFAFQDSTGRLYVLDYRGLSHWWRSIPGLPQLGTAPVFADLDESGRPDVVTARRDGTLTALDLRLQPRWQYDGGAPFDYSPSVAPVFRDQSVVYAQSVDGVIHAVRADGWPLWRFSPGGPMPQPGEGGELLVAQLDSGAPVVLAGGGLGTLYCLDAVDGTLRWSVPTGGARSGLPALITGPDGQLQLVVVGAGGRFAVINADGQVETRVDLPGGQYVGRPIAADVNGDGELEVLAARDDWTLLVLALDGRVLEEHALMGTPREGLVLADLDGDGRLELLAATDTGRLYCWSTSALAGDSSRGWTHPRGGFSLTGSAPGLNRVRPLAEPRPRKSAPMPRNVVFTDYLDDPPFSTAVVELGRPPRGYDEALFVLRQNARIVGSAIKPLHAGAVALPYAYSQAGVFTMDIGLLERDGSLVAYREGIPVAAPRSAVVEIDAVGGFFEALAEVAGGTRVPESWALPEVSGQTAWHLVRYMPAAWRRMGLASEPLIRDAAPQIWAPAEPPGERFGPGHPAWRYLSETPVPFLLVNGRGGRAAAYPGVVINAIETQFGGRFLGFQAGDWSPIIWNTADAEGETRPVSREAATRTLEAGFAALLAENHGHLYPGLGRALYHHHAFAWGVGAGFVEAGGDSPASSLQFAYIRGAARQFGGRPWGVAIANTYQGAFADTRYMVPERGLSWHPGGTVSGPDCGHSASLEFRLAMAAHMAGASFVQLDGGGPGGPILAEETQPGVYEASDHGTAMGAWWRFAADHPERGVPYTPIGFVAGWDDHWQPRSDILGMWPRTRGDLSREAVFDHVFPYGGHTDFERGYLSSGPYGEIFDVLTQNAAQHALDAYRALWPLGDVKFSSDERDRLERYVENGGILVLDALGAGQFQRKFLGVSLAADTAYATGFQTSLAGMAPLTAPCPYRALSPQRGTGVLARSDSGEPLLTWRRHGQGLVIVAGTEQWTDVRNALNPLVPALLQYFTEALVPFAVPDGVQTFINKLESGWVVGVINHEGVSKVPTQPPVVADTAPVECVIRLREGFPLEFTSRLGSFMWSNYANGLTTRLGPGEAAVVAFRMR